MRHAYLLLRRLVIVAVSCFTIVVVFNIHIHRTEPDPAPPDPEFYRQTEVGHRAAIALEDLTQLHLNADTSISVNETPQTRKVVLKKGEVLVSIQHDNARPFEIIVNHAVLADLGTALNVDTHDGVTNVAVIDGRIRVFEQQDNGERLDPLVETPDGYQRRPVYLEVGDISRLEELGDGSVLFHAESRGLAEAKARTSWLRGELNVTTERLDEVVAEFNRYHPERLIIADADIAKMRALPGHYSLADLQAFLGSLQQLGLRADPLPRTHAAARPQEYLVKRNSAIRRNLR